MHSVLLLKCWIVLIWDMLRKFHDRSPFNFFLFCSLVLLLLNVLKSSLVLDSVPRDFKSPTARNDDCLGIDTLIRALLGVDDLKLQDCMTETCKWNSMRYRLLSQWKKTYMYSKCQCGTWVTSHFLTWAKWQQRKPRTWQWKQCWRWYLLILMCSMFMHITTSSSQIRKMSTGSL